MLNPRKSHKYTPADLLDVLNDEELDPLDSDDDIVENVEVDEYAVNEEYYIENMNVCVGSNSLNFHEDGSSADDMSSESEDDGDQGETKETLQQNISSIPGAWPASILVEGGAAPTRGAGAGGRPRRDRTKLRARRDRYLVNSDESSGRPRARGQTLVERLATDEEFAAAPPQGRVRVAAGPTERDTPMRATTAAANLEVEDNVSDAEDINSVSEEFDWAPVHGWHGSKENFLCETPGPTRVFQNAYDAFRSFWDDSLLSHIVDATNRCGRGIQNGPFQKDWFDSNLDELLILFAFWMMLGVIKMPTVKSCFSEHAVLRTEIFRTLFSQDRYWSLNRAFKLASGSREGSDPNDVMYPMGPVIDHLNSNFQKSYTLHQDVCIDESLTLWKGPVGIRQYIKTKAARFEIKTYQLRESSTGYLWSFLVRAGRNPICSTLPSSISTIVKLVRPLLNLGHVIYTNSRLNSPKLARYLKSKHTDCVGILRSICKHVPAVIQSAPLAEGEFVARQSGDVMIVALHDRQRMTYISTFHDVSQVQTAAPPGRSVHHKLKLIEDYSKGIGGVESSDHTLEPYLVERKQCGKWTLKLFKRLLNISIQNSRILLEQCSNTKIDSLAFRLSLVQYIIDIHLGNSASWTPPPRPLPRRRRMNYAMFPAQRLTERHFVRRIPITAEMLETVRHRTNLGRRKCVWCTANGQKSRKTAYECQKCEVALCLETCFENFHTIP